MLRAHIEELEALVRLDEYLNALSEVEALNIIHFKDCNKEVLNMMKRYDLNGGVIDDSVTDRDICNEVFTRNYRNMKEELIDQILN